MSLTKDFVFANTTKTIKNVTKVVEVIAEEYKEETEKVVKVIREKKVEEKKKKKAEAKKNKEEGFLKRIWNYLTSKWYWRAVNKVYGKPLEQISTMHNIAQQMLI